MKHPIYRLTATIPEPASAGLIAMGAMLLRVMRRRNDKKPILKEGV